MRNAAERSCWTLPQIHAGSSESSDPNSLIEIRL
jgi:hypothetical protein